MGIARGFAEGLERLLTAVDIANRKGYSRGSGSPGRTSDIRPSRF
jgi:hypothetical protein